MNSEPNHKCPRCGDTLRKAIMFIIDGPCWKCESTMKLAIKHRGNTIGPDEFTSEELEFAKSRGVVVNSHDSKTAGEKYLANTCSTCGTFVGNFYLFTQFLQPAEMGHLTSTSYDLGYQCESCETEP